MNTCSICNEQFSEFPCNPHPIIANGKCCARCDDLIVTPVRILQAQLGAHTSIVVRAFQRAIELREIKKQIVKKWVKPAMKEIKR
jgi:hypothetical protein